VESGAPKGISGTIEPAMLRRRRRGCLHRCAVLQHSEDARLRDAGNDGTRSVTCALKRTWHAKSQTNPRPSEFLEGSDLRYANERDALELEFSPPCCERTSE
jgi:hypothetical protein